MLASILLQALLGPAAVQDTAQFPDVPKGHWAYQAVLDLKQKGILVGYPAPPAGTVGGDRLSNGPAAHGKPSTPKKHPAKRSRGGTHFAG